MSIDRSAAQNILTGTTEYSQNQNDPKEDKVTKVPTPLLPDKIHNR